MNAKIAAVGCVLRMTLDAAACNPKEPGQAPITPSVARDFGRNPPGVESATIRALTPGQPSTKALLEVRFESDRRIANGVPITLEDRQVVLRDDGKNGDARA